jgi:hypothetical protein
MRRLGGKITKPIGGKSTPSKDTKGFLLQVVEVDYFIDLMKVVNSDTEFQVGVTTLNEKEEWIFAGKLITSPTDSERLGDCQKNILESK